MISSIVRLSSYHSPLTQLAVFQGGNVVFQHHGGEELKHKRYAAHNGYSTSTVRLSSSPNLLKASPTETVRQNDRVRVTAATEVKREELFES